jgi:chorismate synthase
MSGNTFGNIFRLTTFGESHGAGIGGIIDGCPAGVPVQPELIQEQLDRRRPGQSAIVTQRKEGDRIQILSGIFEGKTTGTPIGFFIENTNQKSRDYSHIKDNYRPSHADRVYDIKYGVRDYRGGGRSSARETAARVAAGAIAMQLLPRIRIHAFVSQVGNIRLDRAPSELDFTQIEQNDVRCPDPETAERMIALIREVRKQGDTIGGVVSCLIRNVPIGLGAPVFNKLHAELGRAMLSINAVKGFEYGSGFHGVEMKGSEHNDYYESDGSTRTNNSGGIQGGISNGMDIYFRVAFKPVATLLQSYETIDKEGNPVTVQGKGRHDPCVVPRAVPIVDSMAALVLADHYLMSKTDKFENL